MSKKTQFLIGTEDDGIVIDIEQEPSSVEESLFYFELVSVFSVEKSSCWVWRVLSRMMKPKGNHLNIEFFQKMTEIKKQKMRAFVTRYEPTMKNLNQLGKFIDGIDNGKYICCAPVESLDLYGKAFIYDSLRKLNSGESSLAEVLVDRKSIEQYRDLFGDVLDCYEVSMPGKYIGEPDKKKRTCRFCGKSKPVVQFTQVAHAIPEALGNRNIVNNEECDCCNGHFGKTIDNSLVEFLNFFRAAYQIRGKGGLKTVNFKNGASIEQTGTGVAIKYIAPDVMDTTPPDKIEFENINKRWVSNLLRHHYRLWCGPSDPATRVENVVASVLTACWRSR